MTQWRLTLRKKSLLLIQTVPLVADRPISGRITDDVDSVRRSQPRKPKHPAVMETESADAPAANDAPVADVNVASSEALSAAFSSESQEHMAESQDEASASQAVETPSEPAADSASAESPATADAQQIEKASAGRSLGHGTRPKSSSPRRALIRSMRLKQRSKQSIRVD